MTLLRTPLSQLRPEVRLLRFLNNGDSRAHDQDLTEAIHLELHHAFLDDVTTRYWALSYVWGDTANPVTIYVNDTAVSIRRNLHAALLQLRKNQNEAGSRHVPSFPTWFWVDSICINQSDVTEKTRQVGLMRCIFGGADVVSMWLGPGTEESDLAMDFICRFGPRALGVGFLDAMGDVRKESYLSRIAIDYLSLGPDRKREDIDTDAIQEEGIRKEWLDILFELAEDVAFRQTHADDTRGGKPITWAITDLMSRDYWHRIWIVQEVTLAPKAVVLCGTKSVPLDVFDSALSAVEVSWARSDAGLSGTFYTCIPLRTRRRLVYGKVRPAFSDILVQYVTPPNRPFYSASDPRDLVFGTLGIITDHEKLGLIVDYRKTVVRVFTEITGALLQSSTIRIIDPWSRFGLAWCCPRTEPASYDGIQLPSWVCDWSAVGKYGFRTYPVSCSRRFVSAGARVPGAHVSAHPEILRRTGCRVAVVTEVMEPPQLRQDDEWSVSYMPNDAVPRWLSSIREFAQLGPQSEPGEDYIWRTVQINRWQNLTRTLSEELMTFLRRIWRGDPIPAEALSPAQLEFVVGDTWNARTRREKTVQGKINRLATDLPCDAANIGRNRTLFKTNKLMLGLGHVAVQPGDMVTLLWGEKSPFVLRPREEGGFTFVGDAYVDGIMFGEFLDTEPDEETFDIY